MIVKKEKSEFLDFLKDAANYIGDCSAVYFPETEEELIKIVKNSNSNGSRITIAGNGTGLTGARVPEGGIVISMAKLDKIVEINYDERYAILQPGVVLNDFQKRLDEKNLFYAPDPTEQNCFIGATIATNSSGAKSFKFGATRNFVLELRVVLPHGEIVQLKRGSLFASNLDLVIQTENDSEIKIQLPNYKMPNTKHSAGYFSIPNMDAIDLFIGMEGTLGIITEAKVKLLEKSEKIISGVLFFERRDDALNFVDEVRDLSIQNRNKNNNKGINALGIEYFDFYSLQFLKSDYSQIKNYHHAAIWFEQELTSETEDLLLNKWMNLLEKHNADIENSWFATNQKDIEKFKYFRHNVSAKVSDYISSVGLRKVGTDTAVPISEFRKFYTIIEKKVKEEGIEYICYGHIGDCHLHLNMLPKNELEFLKAKELYKSFCKLAVDVGGTISAEHGIGKMKRDYLLEMFGENGIREMAKTKKSLDPNNILGIGNIFDERFLSE